mgnify:CR=1 FL=1
MLAVMIVQIIMQLFMKGSLDNIMGLFLSLQIICYTMRYKVKLPSITEMVLIEFQKIIEFDILNPEGFAKYIDPEFDLKAWLTGVKKNIVNTD